MVKKISSSETKPLKSANSSRPLYMQAALELKEEIVNGVYPVGALIPTEAELCKPFSVSRYTVREALRVLREEGLVSSRRGATAPRALWSLIF